MKMKTLVAALSGAFLIGAATLAPAQKTPTEPAKAAQPKSMENKTAGISGDQYKQEKDRIEADAKAAKEACKSMKDNAKDVCEAEAKGKEKLAKKELDYKKNPNDKNAQDVEKMKAEVAYEVAKEKCEDMKGADMTKCKKDAKDQKDRAMAAAKGKKMADAGSMSPSRTDTSTTTTKSTSTSTSSPTATPAGNAASSTAPGGTATTPGSEKRSPGK
jgi:hypothetical protein